MRKVFILFTIFMLFLSIISGCSSTNTISEGESASSSQEGIIELKMGHVSSETNGYHVASKYFADKVNEKTNGNLKIEIYPNAQLGGDRDMLENISNGSLELGFISLAVFSNFTPVFEGVQLPFLIEDADVEYQLYKTETIKKGFNELETFDIKGFAIVQNGIHQFGTNKKPIETPEDFKGQKIRSGESTMLLDSFRALGMEPVPMAYPETYNALQTGVIDGGSFQFATWYTDGLTEVIDSVSTTNHLVWPGLITMNANKYNSLSESQKKALEEAAIETQDYMHTVEQEMNKESLAKMKEQGINIIENIDLTPFRNKMEPVYEEYSEKHPLIKETIETVEELRKK